MTSWFVIDMIRTGRERGKSSLFLAGSHAEAHIRRCICGKFERGYGSGVNLSWAQLSVLPLVMGCNAKEVLHRTRQRTPCDRCHT